MPEYRVLIATANYVTADTEEEASQKALAGFLNVLPPHLRGTDHWKVVSVAPSALEALPDDAPGSQFSDEVTATEERQHKT